MPKIVDHENCREDIARAAFSMVRRKGVAKATIRDIAREFGSSVGTVVHYITSKDHIFLHAAEYSTLLIRERMERAEHINQGIRALRHVLYEGLPAGDEMIGHWKIWFGFWQLSETSEFIRAATHDRYDESYRRCPRWQLKTLFRIALERQMPIPATVGAFAIVPSNDLPGSVPFWERMG
ncbi:MAG TPA: TetR/AcrR family transcriptional regulator [Rhizomicrobium sp.]|jgi:AcrR family transcriptional regulator